MKFKDINSTYQVRVIDIDVHEWSEDGQGDHVCSKQGFDIDKYDSLDSAMEGISDYFGYEITPDDCDGQYISASLIEDENAYPDENGKFVASYAVVVERVQPVVFN